MAGHFCTFLDSGSVSTHTKLNFLCSSPKGLGASNSQISRIAEVKRRSLHLRLLPKPSSLTPSSSLDLISTREQPDGSVLFRFGEPSEGTSTEDKDGHDVEDRIMDGDHEAEMMVNGAEREMTSSSLTEVVHRNNSTVVTNKSSTVLAGYSDLNYNFPEVPNDHDLPTISNGELKASSKGDASVAIPESLETIVLVDELADSEHRRNESVQQTEIMDSDRESVPSNLIPSHTSSELATGMQNLMTERGSGSDMNGLTAVDMQDIIAESGLEINNSDAEDQASAAGVELAHEIVEDISESEMNDLMALDMQNAVAGIDHGINNNAEANGTEAQSVKNSIATEDQVSAVGIELAHEMVEDISGSEMNGLTVLGTQIITDATGHGINKAEAKAAANSIAAEVQASETGIDLAREIVEDISKSDVMDLEMQNIIAGTGCGINNNDAEAKSVGKSIATEGAGIVLGHEVIEDISESDTSLISNLSPQREVEAMLDDKAGTMESYEAESLTLNVDLVEASYEMTGLKSTESTTKSKDISVAEFVLVTGVALLPHPSKVLTGGEDAYFVAGQTWLGVADGVGEWSLEGTNPGVFAKDLTKTCERIVSGCNGDPVNNLSELLKVSVAKTLSPGYTTLLIAHFDGQALHVANIGNSGFIILRHGAIYKRSSPMTHAFHFPLTFGRGDEASQLAEFYRVDLEEGDVIIIATDGLLDNLYDQEIALIVTKLLAADTKLQEIAELLAAKAQEIGRSAHARSPFADNAEAAGYPRCSGGKLDDVAVILSVVRRQSSLRPM